MFGRRWRSREELSYMIKNDLKRSWPHALMGFWTGFIVLGAIIVKDTWAHDVPNWYATVIGIYFGVIITMFAYFRTQQSQKFMEEKIRKMEGILNSQFQITHKNSQNSDFQIYYALDGIINTYTELEKIMKKWKKVKGENKQFLKEKILYIWQRSMLEYVKILDNNEIVSEKLYEPHHIKKMKSISEKCKTMPEFHIKSNKIETGNFHRTVIECIILLDKLKLDSKYRGDVIFRY